MGWLNQDEPFAKLGMAKTKQTLFVIVAGPQQQGAPGTCSIAQDGSTTMIRLRAGRFYSFADAKEFAKKSGIALNGHAYIGLEDFIDSE